MSSSLEHLEILATYTRNIVKSLWLVAEGQRKIPRWTSYCNKSVFCWGGHPKEAAQGKVDGSFGVKESVWPEDGQTSQAKENLKAVAVFDTSEWIFLILCRWHVQNWLQGSSCKCIQRTWSPGGCAKISGSSRASVTGQGKFGGPKSRVAGLLGALHVGKVCRSSSRMQS